MRRALVGVVGLISHCLVDLTKNWDKKLLWEGPNEICYLHIICIKIVCTMSFLGVFCLVDF
jgi:membrane-bound metal-dependent hydrolase YbcI (DUF457 family)